MKTQLKQELSQTLKLSPQQIRLGRLIEMTQAETREEIRREADENPAIEVEETSELVQNDNTDDREDSADENWDVQTSPSKMNNDWLFQQHSEGPSLQQSLMDQLRLSSLTPAQIEIAKFVTGNLDANGYLRASAMSISDDMAFQEGKEVEIEDVEKVINVVKELEPAGVGAKDLRECLLLQLRRKGSTPKVALAVDLVSHHLQALGLHHYDKIISALKISKEQLSQALKLIQTLNPKPARGYGETTADEKINQIIPDFDIQPDDSGCLTVTFHNSLPSLSISEAYEAANASEAKRAREFLNLISRRNETLLKAVNAITQWQKAFFLTGDPKELKPMRLKDISEKTGIEMSALSRTLSGKYVQTLFGLYPLKYFLVETANQNEGPASREALLADLKKLIAHEDSQNPMTDDILLKELNAKGYKLSRRTVAKYRELLSILPARLRKSVD